MRCIDVVVPKKQTFLIRQKTLFIQFHTRVSPGEGRGGRSLRRTRSSSRFSAISNSSAGSTPRWDLASPILPAAV